MITEYDDGTEEVRFSDAEWGEMMRDPVYFGYSCPQGHRLREDDSFVLAEGCPTCFAFHESLDGLSEDELDQIFSPAPHFPIIRCGHCKSTHVGVGAVRRCSQS